MLGVVSIKRMQSIDVNGSVCRMKNRQTLLDSDGRELDFANYTLFRLNIRFEPLNQGFPVLRIHKPRDFGKSQPRNLSLDNISYCVNERAGVKGLAASDRRAC